MNEGKTSKRKSSKTARNLKFKKIAAQKRKTRKIDEGEEKFLENIVFGDNADLLNRIDNVNLVALDTQGGEEDNQFFIEDTVGDDGLDELVDQAAAYDAVANISDDELRDLLIPEQMKQKTPSKLESGSEVSHNKAAIWQDEDDQIIAKEGFDGCKHYPKQVKSSDKYKDYLETKFTTVYEPPSWAKKALDNNNAANRVSNSDEDEDDIAIDQTARNYITGRSGLLDKDFLSLKKCTHLNKSSLVRTSVNSVEFHRNSTVALLASKVGLVRLFQVDGKQNSLIQSIYFKNYSLTDAKFLSCGGREEIIVGSDGSMSSSIGYCYYYDMIAGKILRSKLEKGNHNRFSLRGFQISPNGHYLAACDNNGYINILSTSTKENIAELKMNGEVTSLAFSPNSNYLLSHGKDGASQAFLWDIRNLRSGDNCVNRFTDLGTVEASSVAISKTGSLVATGSNMGVINLYKFDDIVKLANPKPIRTVMNLTTAVTSLCFNHDDQLLLMASNEKNDSIRFFNTNTLSVYKNFPLFVGTNDKTYGRINDVDISPNSGYVSFATNNGTGHLFRINEYSSY